MPELPELESIRRYLISILSKDVIIDVKTEKHTVIRYPPREQFEELLKDTSLIQIERIGRILRFLLHKDDSIFNLYIDHGLTGRLGWASDYKKIPTSTVFSFEFKSGKTLIYHDRRLHGAIWLFEADSEKNRKKPDVIKNYGPDILEISFKDFLERISKYRGEIKRILTNQGFITGIGNAYADEILFKAKIHPFAKRTQLSEEEIKFLYHTSKDVLSDALDQILNILNSDHKLDNEVNWRNKILKIHLKGGHSCPLCGNKISTIKAKRITNFCRRCQTSKNRNFI
jgi:formamidopyrimidine-DNA glycosylase